MISPGFSDITDSWREEERGMAEELMRPERLQIKRGLAAEGFEIAVAGMKSQSFGVLRRSPNTRAAAAARDGAGGEPNQD